MNEFGVAYLWLAVMMAVQFVWQLRRELRAKPLLMSPVPFILALAWPLVAAFGICALIIDAASKKDTE